MRKFLARNDNADPQLVLPLVFFSLIMGFILTGTAIVLATQSEQRVAFGIIAGLAALSWASLALLMRKYSRISM